MEKLTLTYETKCRRCGTIHEWAFCKSYEEFIEENWKKLHLWVTEHFNCPSVNQCDICKKETIQDYVSYTGKGG